MERIPRSTPEQDELRRRARPWFNVGIAASTVAIFAAGFGALWGEIFIWITAAAGLVLIVSMVKLIATARKLRRTGPPFQHPRWWWPRRS